MLQDVALEEPQADRAWLPAWMRPQSRQQVEQNAAQLLVELVEDAVRLVRLRHRLPRSDRKAEETFWWLGIR